MADLTREQIIESYFKGQISPTVFDEIERMGVLRSSGSNPDGTKFYDRRFLPAMNTDLTALAKKLMRLEREAAEKVKLSEEEELERKVALRVEQQLSRERARLRKSTLVELSKALAESDE